MRLKVLCCPRWCCGRVSLRSGSALTALVCRRGRNFKEPWGMLLAALTLSVFISIITGLDSSMPMAGKMIYTNFKRLNELAIMPASLQNNTTRCRARNRGAIFPREAPAAAPRCAAAKNRSTSPENAARSLNSSANLTSIA